MRDIVDEVADRVAALAKNHKGEAEQDREEQDLQDLALRAPLPVAPLDLAAAGSLTFRAPDEGRWPALRLAREAMAAGGAAGAVLNGAKEQALDDFIAGRIPFPAMAAAVACTTGASFSVIEGITSNRSRTS